VLALQGRHGRIEVEHAVNLVVAVLLSVLALPPFLARAMGGRSPDPVPKLAALAPVATVPAMAGAVVAASASWWLALGLAIPAGTLVAWQLPWYGRTGKRNGEESRRQSQPAVAARSLRVLTLNVKGGSADPEAVIGEVGCRRVDVLAVQELTPSLVRRLSDAGIVSLLPFCHLDPRPGSAGTGLWSRWPLVPLPPISGLVAAAPRARLDHDGTGPVIVTAVHPAAPVNGKGIRWRRELALICEAVRGLSDAQVVAGDFNASRDHGPFRDLLAAAFVDCSDVAPKRPWPGFTWPVRGRIRPVMRLDHVLVSADRIGVRESRIVRVRGTDHRGVLAVLQVEPPRLQVSLDTGSSRIEGRTGHVASGTRLAGCPDPTGAATTSCARYG
jgi:endonuclease/exonuclease/phosphatase (EEP) superfamily protein YafD